MKINPWPFPFSVPCKHFPQVVSKQMGSIRGEEGGGQGGTTNPRMEMSYSFRGLFQIICGLAAGFYCRRARAPRRGSSLPVEVRSTSAAALETCVMVFYNLVLHNVVLTIKDLKGWAWMYLFIYLFEFHLVSSLQVLLMQVTIAYINSFINCVEKCYI